VEEGVEGVEEAVGVGEEGEAGDGVVGEDGEEGGVHPAGAGGEGDAGVGLVEGEDLHVVRARDALGHGCDEAVPAESIEEDEDGPGAVWGRVGECVCDARCVPFCSRELELKMEGVVKAWEGEVCCRVLVQPGRGVSSSGH
jgi:hypothetical protein